MNSHLNMKEKRCTPQLRSVFESFSTQLSIRDLEHLRSELIREATSSNLSFSCKRLFDELVKSGRIDETNQAQLADYCRAVGRYDLLTIIGGRRAVPVVDPVEEFIKDRQIAENKHAKKYTLKKQDELTGHECNEHVEYTGPLTRSRKRLHDQQLSKTTSEADTCSSDLAVSVPDSAPKQMRLEDASSSSANSSANASSNAASPVAKSHPAGTGLRNGTQGFTEPVSASRSACVPLMANPPPRRIVATGSNLVTAANLALASSNTARLAPSISNVNVNANTSTLIRKKETCDVNLRVRAEYQDHEAALAAAVGSSRETEIERQFERFAQANQVLRSRDLGAIVCEIKFSELTYLDAFWRDYINGSLLHALRDVFITESLRQAVNYEQVRLLITVDEDDYEMGRTRLVHNL